MKTTMTLTSQEERIKILEKHAAGYLSMTSGSAHAVELTLRLPTQSALSRRGSRRHGAWQPREKESSTHCRSAVREQICQRVKGRYHGCNQRHIRDLLEERDGLSISRASLRRIMQEEGFLVVTTHKRRTHRLRRPRYQQEGQLIQIDGSPHAWLEQRGPRLTLIGGIDDATGKVVGAVFREQPTNCATSWCAASAAEKECIGRYQGCWKALCTPD
ncbi:hypothetical protein EPA93_14695 [Ktedonosporobacter rubrisoli]|uniref:HTH-like domain-containing protein n=1 Tax=Ktedonosporobacter rubrisoli TaxID=2509675 RepID=A0A4P6JP87_KTERU|nr:hypothetical protein [Ktedonosporobacter rubrisoli]QBD77178.1 hypothetical protein EPA93_14695 [Ktedonosporobacter rubrisoli]